MSIRPLNLWQAVACRQEQGEVKFARAKESVSLSILTGARSPLVGISPYRLESLPVESILVLSMTHVPAPIPENDEERVAFLRSLLVRPHSTWRTLLRMHEFLAKPRSLKKYLLACKLHNKLITLCQNIMVSCFPIASIDCSSTIRDRFLTQIRRHLLIGSQKQRRKFCTSPSRSTVWSTPNVSGSNPAWG